MGRGVNNLWRCYAVSVLSALLVAVPARGTDASNETAITVVAVDSTDANLVQTVVTQLGATLKQNGWAHPQTVIVSSRSELANRIDDGVADVIISDVRDTVSAISKNSGATVFKVVGYDNDRAPVVLAVKKTSTIQTLDDLRGRSLAFEGLTNRSGYLAPITHLMRAGYNMRYTESVRQPRMPNVINFVFAGDEVNMVAWLDRGLVDAIAFNRSDWDNDEKTPPHIRETLRLVINEDVSMDVYVTLISREVIRQSEVVRADALEEAAITSSFVVLSERENAQLDFLTETAAKAVGNYLAHE